VGKVGTSTFHCLQWDSEEPYLSQGFQEIEYANDATPPTMHHQMVDLGMRHLHQLVAFLIQ
jgi:hypothetical protein